MSIRPLDLQTLFVKLNEVAKQENAARESAVLQQDYQDNQLKKEEALRDHTVNKTAESDQVEKTDEDKEQDGNTSGQKRKKRSSREETEKEKNVHYFEDPDRGKNVDIKG